MVSLFRRKEEPAWEVVQSEAVEPVPMYYDDEDLEIVGVGEMSTGRYVFEVKTVGANHSTNALLFARQQLMQTITKRDFNVLLMESWSLTLYRRGKLHRVEISYMGRPAKALGKIPAQRQPPYLALLAGSKPPPTPHQPVQHLFH